MFQNIFWPLLSIVEQCWISRDVILDSYNDRKSFSKTFMDVVFKIENSPEFLHFQMRFDCIEYHSNKKISDGTFWY
jgi:hypothetical protein